jgi:hypothetical protein
MTLLKRITRSALASLLVLTIGVRSAPGQEPSRDQVGLVFPAFFAEGYLGQSVAFLLKLAVQSDLSSQDPLTLKKGYGRGISYFVPAVMAERSHEQAARLARLNGLQGTLWGYATPLADGAAIQSFLTLSEPYQDYRTTRNELWRLSVGGVELELGPPRLIVSFLSETIPTKVLSEFGSPAEMDFCPVDGGACRRFSDYQVVRAWGRKTDGVVVRRDRKDYVVRFPDPALLASEAVDYAGIFVAYARGNLNQTVKLADRFLERHGPSPAAIDVHLYRAASLARMGRADAARGSIAAALGINPVARRTLRFGIMVELSALARPNAVSRDYFATILKNYGTTSPFDSAYAKLPDCCSPL